MKKILLIFLLLAFCLTPVAIYYINPFDVPTDKIRPRVFGHDLYRIPSKSMLPVLAPGDYIIMSNTAYLNKLPKRGDIIVFNRVSKKDSNKKIPYIKRVIGLPGDTLKIQQGLVLVNNQTLKEDYVKAENRKRPYSRFQPLRSVPENSLFLLGDNRDQSADSRIFGFVPIGDVVGQATVRIFGDNGRSWKSLK